MSWSLGDEYRVCDRCGREQQSGDSWRNTHGWFWASLPYGAYYHQCTACARHPDKCRSDVQHTYPECGILGGET